MSPSTTQPSLVVVITGASSGIGRACAHAFARDKARIVLAARERRPLEDVAAECRSLGAQALVVPADVADADAMRELVAAAIERFGAIDVWLNNVGIGAVGRFDVTPIGAHRRVVEVNLLGQINGAHAVLPHFRQQRRGTLINMISIGGCAAAPLAASYSASKFGLRGFSRALRAELRNLPEVHVCELYPTFVDTPGISHGANYTGKNLRAMPPLLDPHKVAAAIVSLAHAPRNELWMGGPALPARLASAVAPALTGGITMRLFGAALARARRAPITDGNLFEPSPSHAIDGGYRRAARPFVVGVGLTAFAAFAAMGWLMRQRRERDQSLPEP